MKRYIIILALVLAGCAGPADGPVETVTVTETVEVVVPSSTKASGELSGDGSVPFGGTLTWNNNVSITISEPVEAELAEYYLFEENKGKSIIAYEVTVTNDTDYPLDTMDIVTMGTTGEHAANHVVDVEAGLFNPWVSVLPGKTMRYKEAWAVEPGEDFVLEVTYGMGEPGYYQARIDK